MPVLAKHYTSRRQMSESLVTAAFLSVSGGLQDAYTYISRGKVFANAQTGNIVLLSQHICDGDFRSVMHYLVPLVFFALGVAAAELIRQKYQLARRIHWRQLVLIIEILLLFLVGFLPKHGTSLQMLWYPLPALCRYRLFVRSTAMPLPALCVSEISAAVWNPCAPIIRLITGRPCSNPSTISV